MPKSGCAIRRGIVVDIGKNAGIDVAASGEDKARSLAESNCCRPKIPLPRSLGKNALSVNSGTSYFQKGR